MPDVDLLVQYLVALPDSETAILGDDFWYASVPLCVLDAVFSINARYQSVRSVVVRYCAAYGVPMQREPGVLPEPNAQLKVSQLVEQICSVGPDMFASEVLCNRARTSSVNGILKAEASLAFSEVLLRHRIEVLQDLVKRDRDEALVDDLQSVKGQSSGIAVRYFFMLTGASHLIKPDRMILRFLSRLCGRTVGGDEAQVLLAAAATDLGARYPGVTAQSLDYAIWSRERLTRAE